jgi:S-adenosylmethionine:tRNA ribosyltransferase-isomerase
MNIDQFDFELPTELIAQHPPRRRSDGRLLVAAADGGLDDRRVTDLPTLLGADDLLVFNDTRVLPARCRGRKKPGGGRIEILLERLLDDGTALVQVGTSKTVRDGLEFTIGGATGRVRGRRGGFFLVAFDGIDAGAVFETHGEVPLPPYIDRPLEKSDLDRYQTVFAARPGAAAAPTAGLHFDTELLAAIDATGVARHTLTLHVGAGTFQPVRVDRVEEHRMHFERYTVERPLREAVRATRQRGGRVIAVGTTVVRALESAADDSGLPRAGSAETDIFIYPGYRFRVVDALFTNFHLPRSTLLMLVSAFAGRQRVLAAYRHAVHDRYRFFSYGDAMFLEAAPCSK